MEASCPRARAARSESLHLGAAFAHAKARHRAGHHCAWQDPYRVRFTLATNIDVYFAIRNVLGGAALMRTPAICSGSTFRAGPIYRYILKLI
jgi:hypothetical protein